MRTARLALALLLAFGSSQSAKLPGQGGHHNHHDHGAQSSANSGAGGTFWWQNNNAFGEGGGSRPTSQASGNANAHASASSGVNIGGSSSGSASGGGSYGGGSYGGGSQQSGNLQNAGNPPQITVQQPQPGFNPNVFTPEQSPHCARGQDCVRWQLCKNGVISLTGKAIPNQRPVPNSMSAKPCGMLGNVCCAIPANIIATQQQLGHTNQVQTSNFQQPQQSLQSPNQNQQSFPSNNNQQSFPSNQNQQSFPRPSQQHFQNNNNIQPEAPKGPPYPECSASLLCVHQSECNLYKGFIEPQIEEWPGQPFVQINMCTSDTQPEGVCCQEPPTARPQLDQQPSGSQHNNNFQQQFVGQKPQGQHTQQFGTNGQQSVNRPHGNPGHSGSVNRPQTSFQQPNRPAIQQPAQAISFPQQNQPRPQQPSQQAYQQPSQNNNQQPSQSQFQQPSQNNIPHRPQNNIQQPSQNNIPHRPQNNIQQPSQNFQQPTQNQFQQPNQNNFQQQPNRPVNPSHNSNHMPNLNIVGLPNQQSSSQAGPNEQFPSLAPHPTCSSGLFCVQRERCNLYTGFIEEQVQTHADQQFIAINLCTSPTEKDGVCCQEKRAAGSQDDGQYRGPGALDDGQYRGPGATNSGQQQTFVQQGSNPQQGFNQQQAQPQHNNFVAGNPAPQQGFNQQPQQAVGNQHSGVQPGQQAHQQGNFDWQNNDAFQQQVPSYG